MFRILSFSAIVLLALKQGFSFGVRTTTTTTKYLILFFTDIAFDDSNRNVIDLDVDITDVLIEKTAKLLSFNQRAVSGVSTRDGKAIRLGTTGALAVWKSE